VLIICTLKILRKFDDAAAAESIRATIQLIT
jgi:hypothetical protein